MSDTVKSWIEERRAIHAKATPGKWDRRECSVMGAREASDVGQGPARLASMDMPYRKPRMEANATAIVDSHNMFHRALDALSAVIELHKPLGYIGRDGETVWDECEHCHGSGWPCETVQAIEGAINE